MSAKKIGKAVWDWKKDLWGIEGFSQKFRMNERLVESRSEVKKLRASHRKLSQAKRPPRNKPDKREAYFQLRTQSEEDIHNTLARIYDEILQESFSSPVLLRKHQDFDHNSDWRYCLYQGFVYQFDKAGLADEEMIRQIEALEARRVSKTT